MGAAAKLDKQINDYLGQLNSRQKKVVLTVAKALVEDQGNDFWEDEAFIEELDRRTDEFESGKAKVFTLDEMETKVRKEHKSKGKSKR